MKVRHEKFPHNIIEFLVTDFNFLSESSLNFPTSQWKSVPSSSRLQLVRCLSTSSKYFQVDFLNKSRISSRTFSLVKILGAGGGEDRGDAAEQQEEEDGEDKRLAAAHYSSVSDEPFHML